MGTEYYVAASASPIFQEAPNLIRDAVLSAILEDAEVEPYVMASIFRRMDILTDRLQTYCINNYPEAMPNTTLQRSSGDANIFENRIEIEFNLTADSTEVVSWGFVSGVNESTEPYIFDKLYRIYEWNSVDNFLDSESVTTSQPKNPNQVPGTYESWNEDNTIKTTVVVDDTTATTTVETFEYYNGYTFIREAGTGVTDPDTGLYIPESENILSIDIIGSSGVVANLTPPEAEDSYLVIEWHELATPDIPHITAILTGSTNENYDWGISNSPFYDVNFLPIIPTRLNKEFVGETYYFDTYAKASAALKKINIDLNYMNELIADSDDIDLIDDSFLLFAVNIFSEKQASIKYLMKFFEGAAEITEENVIPDGTLGVVGTLINAFGGEIRIKTGDFDMSIRTKGLEKSFIAGGTLSNAPALYDSYIQDGNLIFEEAVIDPPGKNIIKVFTPKFYASIRLRGSTYKVHRIDLNADEDERKAFVIPISREYMDQHLTSLEREELLYDSFHFYFNAIKKEHTSFFEEVLVFVLLVVSVVISVITMMPMIAAAVSAGVAATGILILKLMIYKIIVDYAVEWIFENIENPVIATILAMIVTIAVGDVMGFSDFGAMNLADRVVMLVTKLTDTISSYTEYEYNKMLEEYGEFEKAYTERIDDLQQLREEMGLDPGSLPLVIANSMSRNLFDPYESPDDFFNRTLMSNPGVVTLDSIENYVDTILEPRRL